MCVVYFRSDCPGPPSLFGSPETLTYQYEQLKSTSAHAWPQGPLVLLLSPETALLNLEENVTTAGSAHLIMQSEGHQLTIRRPQISNTSANFHTLQGKTWTEGPSLENTCHQKSRDQQQESCYIHTRRNAEGEVSTTAPRDSAAVFPTGWKHNRACHYLLKLKEQNRQSRKVQ